MRKHFVVDVIGPDRPGIVEEVSQIVAEGGGNIEDSRMAHLGGEFGLLMLFSGQAPAVEEAAGRIRQWAERRGMTAVVKPTAAPPKAAAPLTEIGLEMPDQPGIVSRVTRFLAERGANVEGLESEVRPAPFTGTPIFTMHVNVRSTERIALEELRRALQDLASSEDVHITVGTSV
jgi:glycine cleavage system transcriptional repressor